MNPSTTKRSALICTLALSLIIPSIALCEGSGGTTAKTVKIESRNTIKGDIKAENNSHVSVGDVEVSSVEAKTIDIYSKNDAKAITATDDSTVTMGSVNVSNVKGANLVDIDTVNNVKGKITAKDNSSATIGTVNVH